MNHSSKVLNNLKYYIKGPYGFTDGILMGSGVFYTAKDTYQISKKVVIKISSYVNEHDIDNDIDIDIGKVEIVINQSDNH